MRKIGYLIFVFSSVLWSQEPLQFEAALTLEKTIPIESIVTTPETYIGDRVLIEGTIVDVCSNMGCWIELKGENSNQKIRVKVEDGEIVFPVSIRGKHARVEGTVEMLEYSKEEFYRLKQHEAEEKGVAFDSSAFQYTPADARRYQIRGLGAVVE